MKITIYMKSGNKISVRGVKDVTVTTGTNGITGVKLVKTFFGRYLNPCEGLYMRSIDLSQIEAITYSLF